MRSWAGAALRGSSPRLFLNISRSFQSAEDPRAVGARYVKLGSARSSGSYDEDRQSIRGDCHQVHVERKVTRQRSASAFAARRSQAFFRSTTGEGKILKGTFLKLPRNGCEFNLSGSPLPRQ